MSLFGQSLSGADFGADGAAWIAAALTLDLCLCGAASLSLGRALARAWRPFGVAVPYALALAGGIGFLHYAIFGLSPISSDDLLDAVGGLPADPAGAALRLAAALAGWAALWALSLAFAALGWIHMRRRQMTSRYDWLYEAAGPLGWRVRPLSSRPAPPAGPVDFAAETEDDPPRDENPTPRS